MSEARPSPENIVGILAYIADKLESLEAKVALQEEKRITAKEAAQLLGYGPRYFHGKPWRIPAFGVNGSLHGLSTWKAWAERPEAGRRAEWDSMSAAVRRQARGIAS